MRKATKLWYGLGACVAISSAAVAEEINTPSTLIAVTSATPAMSGVSGAPGEAGESGAEAMDMTDNFPGGFDKALEKVLAGEGGEGGRGLSKMLPSVTSPALSGYQIKKALTGNSLYSSGHDALYYDPSGTLSGWVGEWTLLPAGESKACKTATGTDGYFQGAKGCYKMTKHKATGTWNVKNDQLCQSVTAKGATEDGCNYVALLIETVAFFDGETGMMKGKGLKLLPGNKIP